MSTPSLPSQTPAAAFDLPSFLAQVRPRLHRYCARMAGSALDGEDIVQEALAKAAAHFDAAVRQPEAWVFRVAHNAAMDFLRRRTLERSVFVDAGDDAESAAEEAADPGAMAEATSAALALFAQLPASQRGAVILADVLGHALQEIADIQATTVPAVKAALHRGRTRLREMGELAREGAAPAAPVAARRLAGLYAERFNARDFDGLRALLADEVKLDLAGRLAARGKAQVSAYFGNYGKLPEAPRAEPAVLEGLAGLWMYEGGGELPAYPVVLEEAAGRIATIRDFRYARYVCASLPAPAPLDQSAA